MFCLRLLCEIPMETERRWMRKTIYCNCQHAFNVYRCCCWFCMSKAEAMNATGFSCPFCEQMHERSYPSKWYNCHI